MKKKISNIALSALVISLVGCSESDTTSSTVTQAQIPIPTEITVERGAVYDSNVTDAAGNIAIQTTGTNKYIFSDIPSYPIQAVGGWIDVDGDNKKTVADIELNSPMISYSLNITPLTT